MLPALLFRSVHWLILENLKEMWFLVLANGKWTLRFMFDPVLPIFRSSAVLFVCLLLGGIRKPNRVSAPFLPLSFLIHLYVWVPIPVLLIYFYPT